MRISESVVLISGGSSGLGLACAQSFLAQGARVLILDLAPPPEGLRAEFADRCCFCQASVTNEEEVQRGIDEGLKRFERISAAVLCAGVLHSERAVGREAPASLEAFRRVIDVNLIGTFNVVRLCANAMSKCQPDPLCEEQGVIVMTSSIAAFDGQTGQSAYAASKGAVASMTLPLARDLGKLRIRVISIAPGVFETPMMAVAPENVRQSLLQQTPFPNRFGAPHEFASAVQHVIENAMYNGCTLRLDAGLRMPAK